MHIPIYLFLPADVYEFSGEDCAKNWRKYLLDSDLRYEIIVEQLPDSNIPLVSQVSDLERSLKRWTFYTGGGLGAYYIFFEDEQDALFVKLCLS